MIASATSWGPELLPTGKWIVARQVRRGQHTHREVLTNEAGAFVRFDTEAMAKLMAGKKNR